MNPAITYGVFERLKGVVLSAKNKPGKVGTGKGMALDPMTSFVIGVGSKTLATVVTYPYIFVSSLSSSHFTSEMVFHQLIGGRYRERSARY